MAPPPPGTCETAGCLCGRAAGSAAAAAGGGAAAGHVRPLARGVVDALRAGPALPSLVQVVDELVSNALDAGARSVEVELDLARMCVRVRDDGSGMGARDLDLLGERHATSKLPADRQARLLRAGAAPGGSLGFRGEALHALSQCATVEVRSRVRGGRVLARVLQSGAQAAERAVQLAAVPAERDWLEVHSCGSEVIATEVFSAMPVRRAVALRAAQQTVGGVRGVLERFALASPHVAIVLRTSSPSPVPASSSPASSFAAGAAAATAAAATAARRPAWSFPGARSTREAFGLLFGRSRQLCDRSSRRGDLAMDALVSPPLAGAMQSSAALQFSFVNGRPCKLRRLEMMLTKMYRTHLTACGQPPPQQLLRQAAPLAAFPCLVLSISCRDDAFDVLLGPTKEKLEFRDWDALLQLGTDLVSGMFGYAGVSQPVGEDVLDTIDPRDGSRMSQMTDESRSSQRSSRWFFHDAQHDLDAGGSFSSGDEEGDEEQEKEQVQPTRRQQQQQQQEKQQPQQEKQQQQQEQQEEPADAWTLHTLKRGRPEPAPQALLLIQPSFKAPPSASSQGVVLSRESLARASVLAQVGAKFLLLLVRGEQGATQLLCVDQHAADERVRLESFEAGVRERATRFSRPAVLSVCALDPPLLVSAAPAQALAMQRLEPGLGAWGFSFEGAGTGAGAGAGASEDGAPEQLWLTHAPVCFGAQLGVRELLETVEFASRLPAGLLQDMTPPPIRALLVLRACHGAIKFGDALSVAQCRELVRRLAGCDLPFQCAHGRPTCCPLALLPGDSTSSSQCINQLDSTYPSTRLL